VADDLPPDLPPTAPGVDRLDQIARIAAELLRGKWEAEADGEIRKVTSCDPVHAATSVTYDRLMRLLA
jgi:hypothetical protein